MVSFLDIVYILCSTFRTTALLKEQMKWQDCNRSESEMAKRRDNSRNSVSRRSMERMRQTVKSTRFFKSAVSITFFRHDSSV